MRTVFEAWEQFAYGNVCTRDSNNNSLLLQLRNFRTRTTVRRVVNNAVVGAALAVGSVAHVAATSAELPHVPDRQILRHLKLGPSLGKKLLELRDFLKMSREEASTILHVSESSLQKLEEGEVDMPSSESFRSYIRFLELADYLQNVTGNRRFVMVSLFRSKLPAFGNKTAIELARTAEASPLNYISATFHRMYG